ncbi:GapA-binding peptide SR1P [Pseudalkalibacillus caeni]|uniref:GapA-binding peptide SR1P n=1 Tax=Exobacillus caeni TaxID=2574798 RepID=A0A5R9F5L2_9BACL|nr:GapA-binding peptide SR1P [Pseudalkalibacillus caeni]TLS37690.1 GapA-binding peptide SR1P [Pseudalkalibacillus caeni]
MGIIICQSCDNTISHVEHEKVTTLYGKCPDCNSKHDKNQK